MDEKHQIKIIRDGISFESQAKYACEGFPCFDIVDGGLQGMNCPLCSGQPVLKQALSGVYQCGIEESEKSEGVKEASSDEK